MKTWRQWAGATVVALTLLAGANAQALTLQKTQLVGPPPDAQEIVIANVQNVTDGIDDNGLPYTEITVSIEESLRGDRTGTYAFRQIGLLNPRLTDDGSMMMLAAPEGMPKYSVGERVMLFL